MSPFVMKVLALLTQCAPDFDVFCDVFVPPNLPNQRPVCGPGLFDLQSKLVL